MSCTYVFRNICITVKWCRHYTSKRQSILSYCVVHYVIL